MKVDDLMDGSETDRCYLCKGWAWLAVGDDFMECPNGEEGWSSNDERFDVVPQYTFTISGGGR